jgi:hypothetical protein
MGYGGLISFPSFPALGFEGGGTDIFKHKKGRSSPLLFGRKSALFFEYY